ncbi:MAG: hypothetical protein AABO58_02835 [Acidobacteriota bacterium]
MTFIPTLDTEGKQRPRVPRTLDPVEVRVLQVFASEIHDLASHLASYNF